jgi:hypothetical protein
MIRRSGPRSFVRSSSALARYRYKSAFQLMGNSTTPRENAAVFMNLMPENPQPFGSAIDPSAIKLCNRACGSKSGD